MVFPLQGQVLGSFETNGTGATAVRVQDDRDVVFFGVDGQVVADASSYQEELVLQGTAQLPGDACRGRAGPSSGCNSRRAGDPCGTNSVLVPGDELEWERI